MRIESDNFPTEANASPITEHVASSLNNALSEFADQQKGLNILSERIGIHKKTILRLVNKEHNPTNNTLLKIYRYLLGSYDDDFVIQNAPPEVGMKLKKFSANYFHHPVIYSHDLIALLKQDRIFRDLYFKSATEILHEDEVKKQWGNEGLKTLEKMSSRNIVKKLPDGRYLPGERRAPEVDEETLVKAGSDFATNYFNIENSSVAYKNKIFFGCYQVSEKTWRKIIDLQDRFCENLLTEIQNDSCDHEVKRVFLFNCSDEV